MGLFTRKSPSLLGLDIGASAVKLVELSDAAPPCRVEAFAIEPLPPNAVATSNGGHNVHNISDANAVGEAIRCAVGRAGSKAKKVAVAVAGSAAITKTIALDASLSDADLEAEVLLAADRHLPFPLDDMAMDFESLNLSALDPSQVDVLLAACRLEQVESLEAATALGGLKAAVVDIDAFCLQRAIGELAMYSSSTPLGVVEIDTFSVALTVCDGDAVIFHREEPLDASLERGNPTELPSAGENPVHEEALRVVSRLLRLYASAESRHALATIKPPGDSGLNRLLLAGDGACSGLADAATQRLGVSTELLDPFANVAAAKRIDVDLLHSSAPRLTKAYGLALRTFDHHDARSHRWYA